MTRLQVVGMVALAAMVVAIAFLVMGQGEAEDEAGDGNAALPSRTEGRLEGRSPSERQGPKRAGKPKTDRQKVMEELKERWLVLQPKGNRAIKEQDELAKESAAALLCSLEAITLLAWMEKNELRYGAVKLRHDLERRLKSGDAGDLREQLTTLPALPHESGKDGHYLIQNLCNAAGQGCSVEEFDAFYNSLQSDSYAQEAMLGRNRVLMRSDPAAGILSTLEILEADVHSLSRDDHLKRQMGERLPEGVDFAELESLLPPPEESPGDAVMEWSPVDWGRHQLVRTWATSDPGGAADYVVQNPERLGARSVRAIGSAATFTSTEEAVAWVERFPEGEYFDQAAMGVLHVLAYRDRPQAQALAERIGDAELRTQAIAISEREFREEGG